MKPFVMVAIACLFAFACQEKGNSYVTFKMENNQPTDQVQTFKTESECHAFLKTNEGYTTCAPAEVTPL